LGILDQGTGNGRSLLLSAGQLGGQSIQHALPDGEFQRFRGPAGRSHFFQPTAIFRGEAMLS
jgi:hypothetical protein